MRHLHRRPPAVHTFTPYPPIHVADLSRPAARQPWRPRLLIPQLLPPRRRDFARPRLTKGPNAGQRHRGGSARHTSAKYEPPWGHYLRLCQFCFPTRRGRCLCGIRSAKTDFRNQVLPHRLGACLASRFDHRPTFGIPSTSAISLRQAGRSATGFEAVAQLQQAVTGERALVSHSSLSRRQPHSPCKASCGAWPSSGGKAIS